MRDCYYCDKLVEEGAFTRPVGSLKDAVCCEDCFVEREIPRVRKILENLSTGKSLDGILVKEPALANYCVISYDHPIEVYRAGTNRENYDRSYGRWMKFLHEKRSIRVHQSTWAVPIPAGVDADQSVREIVEEAKNLSPKSKVYYWKFGNENDWLDRIKSVVEGTLVGYTSLRESMTKLSGLQKTDKLSLIRDSLLKMRQLDEQIPFTQLLDMVSPTREAILKAAMEGIE